MNLTERLQELAETPAPPMRVDIERARAAGQRRRRGRQAAIVATAAAVVLAVAVATPAVLRSTRPVEQAPASLDGALLVTHAMFGWLPDSITRVDLGQGGHGDYAHAVNENADLGTHLWLTTHPAGDPPKPPSFGTATPHTVPAAPVNGQPAYWLTTNPADPLNGGDAHLYWQANGKLAELYGYYLSFFDNPEDVLLRVAAAATITDRAIPLPVSVRDVPTDYQLTEVMFDRPMRRDTGTGAWDLSLFYSYNGASLTVLVHPTGSVTTPKDGSNTTCSSTNGIDLCVAPGPDTILDHITVLGLDESTWRAR
jgi:hypothetical protein